MPKPYVRKMPTTWWLQKSSYFYFMLRELTAVFMAAYCVLLLVFLWHLKQAQSPAGREAYDGLIARFQSPLSVGFHFVALVFAIYHSITWFNLTPKVMVIRRGEEKVPPLLMIGQNYVVWLLVSALLVWLVFW